MSILQLFLGRAMEIINNNGEMQLFQIENYVYFFIGILIIILITYLDMDGNQIQCVPLPTAATEAMQIFIAIRELCRIGGINTLRYLERFLQELQHMVAEHHQTM
jgi:hypothetical protein